MGMIKNLWRGFRGGPDFSEVNPLNASLENIQFSVELPYSNIDTNEPPRSIHFPIMKDGWFDQHAESLKYYRYVHVDTQMWFYVPSVVNLPSGELGVLTLMTQIKRIPEEKNISAFDLDSLGKTVISEYEDYYNSPIIGWDDNDKDPSLGKNTKIRRDILELANSRSEPWSQEFIDREINLRLSDTGYAPLKPHKIKTINGRSWLFYIEQKAVARPAKNRIYCMPLTDKYYLCLDFGYRVDRIDKFKLWKDHAEAAEKRIMESVKLTIPNDELALTHQG
ncbi:hypothetical protein [Litoribrevibacter albus]|uniref:Uncharacterized protein n=1 Tax=Litoribrevibacter albus TaxID=1473156 RepID=A0AA37W7S8_9GAMM|nr:hypothetical protein [Litoribrevibacter albus]GLQ31544.1 hypothetical protein GCM10007876_20230 [Litoribrevibacter albus]